MVEVGTVIKEVLDGSKIEGVEALEPGSVVEMAGLELVLDETTSMLGSSMPQLSFSDPRP